MIDPIRSVPTRWIAVAALLCFLPVAISLAVAPDAWWIRNYPGILFHLVIFLLVSRLEAPEWAKAAGYGWLVLDVMTGVLTLNGVPHEIYDFVRLGGHIFGGIWIATASLSGSRAVQVVGVITGLYLGGFTFFAPFLSQKVLQPAGTLVLVWLAIIAWQNGSKKHQRKKPIEAAALSPNASYT